ncbi:MAG: SDR family NAD(P)-dependent oxidoreductase [Actinomycetota bacterium]|nr:SDR family NAD(P)-dependent oxidoreductase [Actinomycetota bacterium]
MLIEPDRPSSPRPLSGRGAIVTGAARGIGRGIAHRLAHDGARVVLVDRDPAVHDAADALGTDCTGVEVDLRDPAATTEAMAAAVKELGSVWALVNNAGVFAKTPLLDTPVEEWDLLMEVNARSMLVTIQAVAPAMIEAGGGRIVNQASMAAKKGTPGEAAYAASKAAVVALTRIAASELGAHGITVNATCPGYVLTEMGADTRDPGQVEAWSAQSPLGRLASVDDVASVVAFLASDRAGYLTGQAINVTGGMCTW